MADKGKSNYESQLGGLANKLKSTQVNTPLQEVLPVAGAKKIKEEKPEEAQLNVWIPKDLFKKLKRRGLDADMTLKEITIKALENYLSK
ncbi:hypothetical protein [Rufibacter roseus]|uniref:CopG family transcriptional regulator n=1 Tax=Rufibacter roseus TaxID=1567108 RepID=A0ABW2DP31_9BACT|nr:hypothetical protein [Rufibacter roseus]